MTITDGSYLFMGQVTGGAGVGLLYIYLWLSTKSERLPTPERTDELIGGGE